MNHRSNIFNRYYRNLKEEKHMRNIGTDNINTDNRTIAMNMKEEREMKRKMENIMKTGFIATGTAAAGLALGLSPVTAHAAEIDTNAPDAALQACSEMSAPETVADAENAVNAAQAEVETTDAAVKEAENRVREAETALDNAFEEADTARSEADKAFEDAKSEAARADAAAQNDLEAAERTVAEAEDRAQHAGEEVASAEESLLEAESNVREDVQESTVTESDISDKESELADAETDLSNAERDFDEAESTRNEAFEEAQQKETARQDAEDAVKDAEAEKAAADAAAASAEETAGQADQALQYAEDLKNGTQDIKDTVQYKEEQEAKERMEKAAEAAGTASKDTDKAAEDFENAAAAVDAAAKELNLANEELKKRESALSEAEKEKKAADTAREKAANAYNKAAAEAAGADSTVSEAEKAVTEAKNGVRTAETAKAAADNAVKKAADAVTNARQAAEADVNADIAAAEKEAVEKQSAAETAQEALDAVTEKYKQGTLGLIDWMLAKNGLSKDQTQDLTFAREVLMKASEEDFSKWYGGDNTGLPEERGGKVVVIGDEIDATNLENLFRSIEVMKKINELRATDDNYTGDIQRNDAYTNFYFMATAEAGAMRGSGLRNHSLLTTSCENLAFGYSDPTVGWYNEEKAVFDWLKEELGITTITSMKDVERIEEEAESRDVEIGHYTNLFWAADQAMGVGYTPYRRTYCYNASKASNYTDDRYDRAMHLYTVEEFEQLAEEYYQSVDRSAYESALKAAGAERSNAESRLQNLINNKGAIIESAIKDASSALASKESDAAAAAQTLTEARKTLADAEEASAGARAVKLSADQTLKAALAALNKAADESRTADTGFAYAEKARDDAGKSVAEAESLMKDAIAGKESAASVLEEKKAALTDANNALHDASAFHAEAEKKLMDLTSENTLAALREQKQLADAVLQSALANQSVMNEALKQAKAVLAQAEASAFGARTSLQEAENRLAEAAGAKDSAEKAVDQAARELEDLRAIAARDAAKENLRLAEAALNEAESDLAGARTGLAEAQTARAITADRLLRATGLSVEAALKAYIEDPDFTYLNDYVDAMRAADTEVHSARESLDNANAELSSRKNDSENAQKVYIAALANLAVAMDRAEMTQVNPEPVFNPTSSAGTTDQKTAAAGDRNEKDSGTDVIRDSDNPARPVLRKAESTGRVYCTETAATGDTSNIMALLAELLASAGLMAVVFRTRKEKDGKKVQ